jgi:nickel-dependent lactate racemase
MIKKFLKSNKKGIEIIIPEKNFLYYIEPEMVESTHKINIAEELRKPIASKPLSELIKPGMKVVILADDLTRPTPQKEILPILIEEINKAGVEDKDISIIIALGTHRYMKEDEILERFGKEIIDRVSIVNNEWKNKDIFIDLGMTESGIPILVNRQVYEADFVVSVGVIATHDLAGWSGGCKMIQPGVCSWDTTLATHVIAGRGDLIGNLGDEENVVRKEIESVGKKVGLDFVLNVVMDSKDNILKFVCGDPVKAHREGVKYVKPIYVREIPALADIAITNAYPADLDYWQGVKPLLLAQKGIKPNGTVILIGDFPEGIAPTHPEYGKFGTRSFEDIDLCYRNGEIEDGVCAAALMEHSKCIGRSKVICISDGLTKEEKSSLNFIHADDLSEALKIAYEQQGKDAKIGIIEYGGDVIPVLKN